MPVFSLNRFCLDNIMIENQQKNFRLPGARPRAEAGSVKPYLRDRRKEEPL